MNDRLRLTRDSRVTQSLNELDVIQAHKGGEAINQNDFRQSIYGFLGRHQQQSLQDGATDLIRRGNAGAADDEYMAAVSDLTNLYNDLDGDFRLSRDEQQQLLSQAEQVVYADLDSYAEQQLGRDAGLYEPGRTTDDPAVDASDDAAETVADPSVSDEAVVEDPATTDAETVSTEGLEAPMTDVSPEDAANLRYNQAPNAAQVVAGAPIGMGHKDGADTGTVRDIQTHLSENGHYPEGSGAEEIDGFFGPKSRDALIAWQTEVGLEADGTVDADDLERMGLAPASTATPEEVDEAETTEEAPEAATSDVEVRRMATQIQEDLRGIGTSDYGNIASQIAGLSPDQLGSLRTQYAEISNGESLEDAIRGDVHSNIDLNDNGRQALLGLISGDRSPTAGYNASSALDDARALHETMRSDWYNPGSWGTRTGELTELLTNRSPDELKQIAEEYDRLPYGGSLRDRVQSETSGPYRDVLMAMFDEAGI